MERAYKKVRLVFVDHLGFKPLTKFLFPFVAILSAPFAICLHHFPVGAHHGVAFAIDVTTPKFIPKFQRYFFQ
jgi:hypothetical protein